MVSELGSYLIEQLQKGYSREQLKEHLLAHHYTKDQIAQAFAEITHEHLSNAEPDLQDYVESYISQGYKAEQLYAALKDEGYSKRFLDKTFKHFSKEHFLEPAQRPKKRWKKPDAIAIIMILPIVLFILVLAYLFNTPSGEIPLVDDVTKLSANKSSTTSDSKASFPTLTLTPANHTSLKDVFNVTNQTIALTYCDQQSLQEDKDVCYQYVAETYENATSCSFIASTMHRDNCYLTFILLGEQTYCSKLALAENAFACQS